MGKKTLYKPKIETKDTEDENKTSEMPEMPEETTVEATVELDLADDVLGAESAAITVEMGGVGAAKPEGMPTPTIPADDLVQRLSKEICPVTKAPHRIFVRGHVSHVPQVSCYECGRLN